MEKIGIALALVICVLVFASGGVESFGLSGVTDLMKPSAKSSWSSKADVTTLRRTDRRGYKAKSPAMATLDDTPLHVDRVLEGARPIQSSDSPSEIHLVAQPAQCELRPPQPGDVIGNVQISETGAGTPIYTMSEEQRISVAKSYVLQTAGNPHRSPPRPSEYIYGMRIADAIITDTSGPVYLILQSETGNILWNVHKAPGVFIAQITIIANGPAGIVAPDLNVPTQILDTTANKDCVPHFLRQPEAHWQFVKEITERATEEQRLKDRNYVLAAAYDAWFQTQFGISAAQDQIGYQSVNHVLVGPPLAEGAPRVPYTPIKGNPVYVSEVAHVYAGDTPGDAKTFGDDLTLALVREASGGSLESFIPKPLEAAQ